MTTRSFAKEQKSLDKPGSSIVAWDGGGTAAGKEETHLVSRHIADFLGDAVYLNTMIPYALLRGIDPEANASRKYKIRAICNQ